MEEIASKGGTSMRRILLVCLLVIGLLLMASCGGGSSREATAVEDTIRGYVTKFNAGDYTRCLTYFTDYGDEEDALAFLSYMRSISGELELREIKDIAITGKNATATVVFTIVGEDNTDQVQLKKVQGQWKIIWEQGIVTEETAAIEDAGDVAAIEDTIRGYFAAYNAEDYATCLTYFTELGDEESAKSFLSRDRDFWGKRILRKVEDIKATDSMVTARYQVIIEGTSDTNQVKLKKIGGQWRIVWEETALSTTKCYMPNPARGVLPGSVEIAPEFQTTLQADHCLWMGEDGQLRTYWRVRNIGDQPTAPLVAMCEIYDAEGELLTYHNPSGILEPGWVMGTRDIWPQDHIVTQSAARYKIIVKGM